MNPTSNATRSQNIQSTIRAQLDAFSRGDHLAAFALSSTAIQAQFGNAELFGDKVRSGYPQLYHSRSVVFGRPTTVQGRVAQPAEVTGEDGITLLTLFLLMPNDEGAWQIDGVLELQPEVEKSAGLLN